MKAALARQNYLVILAMLALVVLISAPVYTYRIMNPTDNDYGTHIQFALDMLKRQPVPAYTLAHPVIQVLLIGILWVTRGKVGFWVGLILVQVVAQALTALILYQWFGQRPGSSSRWSDLSRRSDWVRALWAVTLTIAAPVMALLPLDGKYYYGYIGLASYHNPTVHLLRPFALVSLMIAIRALRGPRSPLWLALLSAALIVFSALIKPNYALTILPALGLLAGIRWLRKQPVDWRLALGGFAVPAVLVLAGQALVTFADGGSIALQPPGVEAIYSNFLAAKFLLSIIFPLAVLAAFFPAIRRDPEMILAWVIFAAGALQVYLLVESGDRLQHGNFRWSAQIGLFLLFAASARFLWRCAPALDNTKLEQPWLEQPRLFQPGLLQPQLLVVALAYLPHVIAGVIYYLHAITSIGYG